MAHTTEANKAAALAAIGKLFGNSAVPTAETREALQEISTHIDDLLTALSQQSREPDRVAADD